jgi:hypothetical protein
VSYCRWSSDDSQCDVYVYEDCAGGFTTHVAGCKHVFKESLPPEVSYRDNKAFFARYEKINKMIDAADMVNIGLPHDGETFNDDTAEECADRLESLRAMGYRVPQYAIDSLRGEEDTEE